MAGERSAAGVAGLEEAVLERERLLPQPGARVPAPGELAVVQGFLNTHFDLIEEWGADVLATPAGLSRWFAARGLMTSRTNLAERDADRARALRDGLRALVSAGPTPQQLGALNEAAAGARLEISFSAERPQLVPAGASELDRALGRLLSIVLAAVIDGSWSRLKVCPGEHCGWAFYDHSRNNSGRWCSMAVCGGRAKARSHYRRRRPAEASG
jgi:predicted RNA-binding Zn ribbon-like protein